VHDHLITAPPRQVPVIESVVLPPDTKRSMMIILRPLCPTCQTRTMLARITRGRYGFDIRTFECPACDDVHQIVAEIVDPMTSAETRGWLQGELRAPT
jgi:hypothetical protein